MGKIQFEISRGANDKFIGLILEDTRTLLAEVGLEIKLPKLLKELAGHDGVRIKGERVCFDPELVEKARMQVPEQDTNYASAKDGENDFRLCPPFSPFKVLDFETGGKRPAAETDVVEGARVYDSFGVSGPVHVHLENIEQKTAQLNIAKLCCENSRAIGNWSPAYSYEEAVAIRDMYLAAGREGPSVAFQLTHSPLRLDAYFLEIIMQARDEAENGTRSMTAGGGAMPLAGVSSPIDYRSAAAQGLAECLGAWVTLKLIDPSLRPYASFMAWVPDMSTGKWAFDLPESIIFDFLNRQVMRELLGLSVYHRCGNLSEMCLHAVQGARIFELGGLREDCFSMAHIPVDMEKVNFVERLAKGMEFSEEEGLTLKTFQETMPETSFLMHESTLAFSELLWKPSVFTGRPPASLAKMLYGEEDKLLPQAREIVRKRLETHEFELDKAARSAVERIFEAGCKAINDRPA
jgi:trimethylamine:corrinoid methyltransferase-like protein